MKKRCLTIFLALALVLTVLPAGAWAARQSASVGEMRLTGTDLLLYRQLKENGVLVRWFDKDRIRDYVRITIGSMEQLAELADTLDHLLDEL